MSLRFASARKHSHPAPRAASQETQSELSVYLFPSAPATPLSSGLQLDRYQPVLRPRLESATSNGSAWTLPEGSQTPQEGDISSLCSFTDEEDFFDAPEVRNRRPLQIWTAPLPPDISLPMNGIRIRLRDPAAEVPLHIHLDDSLSDVGGSVKGTTADDRTAVPSPATSQGWLMDLIAKWIGIDRDTLALVYPSMPPGEPSMSLIKDSVSVTCTQRLGGLLTFESREAHGGEVRKGLRALSDVES